MTTRETESATTDEQADQSLRRAALLAGPVAAIVFVGGMLLAAYVFSPTRSFNWTGDFDQFSILRHQSIALGSLLGLVFLWPVWENTTNRIQQAGIGLFGIAFVIELIGNGLHGFLGVHVGDWHVIGLILFFPVALLVYGGGDASAGYRRRGGASLALGIIYLANVWLTFPMPPAPEGYGLIFYFLSFVLVSGWAVLMYVSLRE